MSAREEICVKTQHEAQKETQPSFSPRTIRKLGIIAGGGELPRQLLDVCENQGIECCVVGFKGYTDHLHANFKTRIGASGGTISWLKKQEAMDLVMIGAIKRPSIFDLWPDWITAKFFAKAWLKSFGDNSLLSAAREELESQGFRLHGIHKFLPHLLMPEGVMGYFAPQEADYLDIQLGLKSARELGAQDIGQAVIVKDQKIIGRESQSGTSALIKRYGCAGAILVKTSKPQQDKDLDLPTIGPETAALCVEKKMKGLVGQAGHTLMVDKRNVVKTADDGGLFVVGVTIDGS